jgi:hypothetical protein
MDIVAGLAADTAKLPLAVGANPRKTAHHETVKPRERRRCVLFATSPLARLMSASHS